MSAIFFALVAYFGWAVSDIFVTISSRKLNAYSSTFWTIIFSILFLSFYVPFATADLKGLTINVLFLNIGLGFVFMLGLICFREGLIRGSSPLIAVISAAASVVVTILSVIFLEEKLNLYQQSAIVIIFIGLMLTTLPLKELVKGRIVLDRGVVFALMAMLLFGVYFTFIKVVVRQIGWFWPNYLSFLFFPPLMLLFIKVRHFKLYRPTYHQALLPLILAAVFGRAGELGFNLGIEQGFTSVVAPIAGSNPTLFVILAALYLKDPITRQQVLGIITTLIGIVLLSIFSV